MARKRTGTPRSSRPKKTRKPKNSAEQNTHGKARLAKDGEEGHNGGATENSSAQATEGSRSTGNKPFKLELSWQFPDWHCSVKDTDTPGKDEKGLDEIVRNLIRDANASHITDTLNAFQRRYYPDETVPKIEKVMDALCERLEITRPAESSKPAENEPRENELWENELWEAASQRVDDLTAYIISENKYPWIANQALGNLFKGTEELEDLRRQILRKALEKEWRVSWHWRAVLPVLRLFANLEKRGKILVLQVSHVRKWELLLCYEVSDASMEEFSGNISKIPLQRKELLIPPIFGVSNRMHGWDAFRLLFMDSNLKALKRSYDAFKEGENTRTNVGVDPLLERERACLVGRHDCYYLFRHGIEPGKIRKEQFERYRKSINISLDSSDEEPLEAANGTDVGDPESQTEPSETKAAEAGGTQEGGAVGTDGDAGVEIKLKELKKEDREITKRLTYTMVVENVVNFTPEQKPAEDPLDVNLDQISIYQPYDLLELPAFASDDGVNLLLSSDNFCVAMEDLTDVLNDPTAKSLLIVAPPGSGKEHISHAAYECRAFRRAQAEDNDLGEPPPRGKFVATTLAGLSADEAAKMLFRLDPKEVDGSELRKDYKPKNSDGLFFQAIQGALFIDEIDKAGDDTRSMLLRVLESGDVNIPETSMVVKIRKGLTPLYIFAGSRPRREMVELLPFDFWTRISHTIEMSHPLDFDDINETRRVAADYVWMFWMRHVRNYFENKGFILKLKRLTEGRRVDPGGYDPANFYYREFYEFLLSREVIEFVSDEMADEIVRKGQPPPSIRMIGHLVGRAVFRFTESILHPKSIDDPIEEYKRAQSEGDQDVLNPKEGDSPRAWFRHLAELIADYRRGPTEQTRYSREFLQLYNSLRGQIRKGGRFIG